MPIGRILRTDTIDLQAIGLMGTVIKKIKEAFRQHFEQYIAQCPLPPYVLVAVA